MAVLGIPFAGPKRSIETLHDSILDARREQSPHRLGGTDRRVEQLLRAVPESFEESVGAIGRSWDVLDARTASERGGHCVERVKPGPLDRHAFSEVILLPSREMVEVEGEDDDRSPGDPS